MGAYHCKGILVAAAAINAFTGRRYGSRDRLDSYIFNSEL
jgi:hypothetical protein